MKKQQLNDLFDLLKQKQGPAPNIAPGPIEEDEEVKKKVLRNKQRFQDAENQSRQAMALPRKKVSPRVP